MGDNVNNLSIRTIDTKVQGNIQVILPAGEGELWIGYWGENFLRKIDLTGKQISKSVNLDDERMVYSIDSTPPNEIIVTTFWGRYVKCMDQTGTNVRTVVDVEPWYTFRLCAAKNDTFLLTLSSKRGYFEYAHIRRYSMTGEHLQNIDNEIDRNLALSQSVGLTELSTGEIIIVDQFPMRVIQTNSCGKRVATFSREDLDKTNMKMALFCAVHDEEDNVYISDYDGHNIYMIPKTGTDIKAVLYEKQGLKYPVSLSYLNGKLFIGCSYGVISIAE